jgi:hypothetical protein
MDFYQGYDQLMEFSTAVVENPFGAQLLAMLEGRYDDIEIAVADVTEKLQKLEFDADEVGVVKLMTGELAPTEELLEALAGMAKSDAEVQRLYNSAASMYEMLADAIEAGEDDEYEIEDEEYDDEVVDEIEDEDEEEEIEDEVSSGVPVTSQVEDTRVDMLYSRQVVSDQLNELMDVADGMMKGGKGLMTPYIKNLLFGKSDKNRYAEFSATCDEFEVNPETLLTCIEFSLNLLAELEGVDENYFKAQVTEDMSDGVNFSSRVDDVAVDKQSREMLELLGL